MHDDDEGFELAYVDSGERPTLLLIHGFPLSSSMWNEQVDRLGDLARVIAVDLRGHGNSSAVPGTTDVGVLAEDCADLIAHLGVAAPVVVCGHSMGGYVALELYRRHPEQVGALILVSTRADADSPEARAKRDATLAEVREKGTAKLVEAMLPKLLAPQTQTQRPELVDTVRAWMNAASVEGVVGALEAMRDRPDSTATLGALAVPVLVVHGTDDELIPPSEGEATHRAIAGSTLALIEGAGHLPNLEQRDAFDQAVIEFLIEVDDRSQAGLD